MNTQLACRGNGPLIVQWSPAPVLNNGQAIKPEAISSLIECISAVMARFSKDRLVPGRPTPNGTVDCSSQPGTLEGRYQITGIECAR
jgi:hypothetical protein